ncbi:helix-turn-helix domain-containing protein [Actinoplanes derwentensis]|uniref:Helix-turn-helix domain-containing protein n=1 Tax=Actinoplanes derwentensis TaxID=113562 RepID=A0A1H2CW61_9ACTN|nr:helix-turn-helix domain-containing protein [Actinoplanes derwentensis]GID82059.1 hypothetical protein Ade03nite_09830 [Actinoplanes derwentensis]SDT74507.1 hypothetical protein SAMN04489716_7003 [Actinoplanes derwentensis]
MSIENPNPNYKLTEEERKRLSKVLADGYAAGGSIKALAASIGRSYGTVHKLLTEAGVKKRPRGFQKSGRQHSSTGPAS